MKNSPIRCRFGTLFFITILFILLPGTSQSLPDLPDNYLDYPVLLMSKEGTTGSGFFYNKDDATYLITARHVLFQETSVRVPEKFEVPKTLSHKFYVQEDKEKREFILYFYGVMLESERNELMKAAPKSDQDQFNFKEAIEKLYKESQKLKLRSNEITLFSYAPKNFGDGVNKCEVQLTKLFESGQVKYHPSQDVAFIRIGNLKKDADQQVVTVRRDWLTCEQVKGIFGLGQDNFKLLRDVIVGNPVFVFGYPTSITGINPWLNIKLPLLRKGIIAGKNEDLRAIILDCPAFYGNSGGLVIEVERTTLTETQYKAIGLITNFVPYKIDWFQNSGYSVVVPMDFVLELITGQNK